MLPVLLRVNLPAMATVTVTKQLPRGPVGRFNTVYLSLSSLKIRTHAGTTRSFLVVSYPSVVLVQCCLTSLEKLYGGSHQNELWSHRLHGLLEF